MIIRKVYIDMDGVLADFERGVQELAGMMPTPINGRRDAGYDDRMWTAIRKVEHFYGRLKPMPEARAMFDAIRAGFGDRCEILTGIPKPRRGILHAREDKLEWVRRLLDKDIVTNVVLREEKPRYCTGRDCVLIDDSERNIFEWESTGGTGILFTGPEETLAALGRIAQED